MIIVAGYLRVAPDDREGYLVACRSVVTAARAADGCLDFALSPDPIEPDRINVLERWQDRHTLTAFRGDGSGEDLGARIVEAQVSEFECDSGTAL
ncbi:putative quinol monooxygenase [Rhodococcus sp. AG1013]|uniref:putative quinol monooxygenase n=1 Tax=unclassified Rhodococcus (in: high G+C Gram-positive bacteria) TaxID=192944 RepID=UPI000E0C88DB|nr:antibiotic biosynthesis monooxygenase [Rhodococcus sp. AG1013]RDI32499.1 antibiotic biosynthesis monooxygenase [Rhodococcus sp. AG1013]